MPKNKRKKKPINFVHKHMVEQHVSVAHASEKDYNRQKEKSDLKKEISNGESYS